MRKVYRIASSKRVRDLSGTGSALYGGRWNPRGFYVLYTSGSASLAMLEWLAHARDRHMDEAYFMATLLIPDSPIYKPEWHELPASWQETPPLASVQQFGAKLFESKKCLAIEMPSVIMPVDCNVVIDVGHLLFSKIEIASIDPILLDSRLKEE